MAGIINKEVSEVLQDEYLKYAGYVLQERAIPDSRDCLKDGARKILWSMYKNKQTHDKKTVKGNAATSGAMFYSVHGDASIYGTIMRMAQNFSLRYPLIFSDTNVGSILAGTDYAAGRYTEVKSSTISGEMLKNIEKNTVNWLPNYDGTKEMPDVLPSFFPNVCNGSTGIGVGAACSIPQFNVVDVCNALIKLIYNSDLTFDDLYCPVDFATGGIVTNEVEVKESLKNGSGKAVKLRAKIVHDEEKNELVVTELPYQVFTNRVAKQLADRINDGSITQLDSFFDATNFNGVSIRMKLIKNANIGLALKEIYGNTALENHVGINMNMLQDGRKPRVYGWKEILVTYLEHIKTIVLKSHEFDLSKILNELEINEGYEIALAHIKEIVDLILHSDNNAIAINKLMSNYGLSEKQARAILDLKLQRLTKLESVEVNKKIASLKDAAKVHKNIIENTSELNKEVISEFDYIKNKYGDSRRTVNTNIDNDDIKVPEKDLIIYISNSGAAITNEVDKYTVQNRGGKGSKVKWSNKSDFIWQTIYTSNTENLLVFTNKAKSYILCAKDFILDTEFYLQSLVEFENDEKIISVVLCSKLTDKDYIIFGTKNGIVKKSLAKEYTSSKRKTGLQAIKLRDDDSLVAIKTVTKESDNIVLITEKARCIIFNQNEITSTSRATSGVIGIKLKDDDTLVDIIISSNTEDELFTITNIGYGKKTKISEFSCGNRAIQGVVCHKLDENETLAGGIIMNKPIEFIVFTSNAAIRLLSGSISSSGRVSKGTKIMDVNNLQISGMIKLEN